MKLKAENLIRAGMYLLVMMPLYGLLTRVFTVWSPFGLIWLCGQTLLAGFVTMLPKYVGNYNETEVIRYEGGANRGDDPNPDRESRHETIREGRRFPLRAALSVVALIAVLFLLLLVPDTAYLGGEGLYRFGFIATSMVLFAGCLVSLNTPYCLWTELPGIAIGFLSYIAAAIVFQVSDSIDDTFKLIVGLAALAFIYGGFVCLNRVSLNAESGQDADESNVPSSLRRRNRRVVLVFASIIAVISFVKPVRDAALWVLRWILVFFRWLAWLLRGGKEVDRGNLDALLAMQGMEQAPILQEEEIVEEMEQVQESAWDRAFVYIFFGFLALGVLFLLYNLAMKKLKRDGFLFRRPRKTQSEGYYDEKEELESDDIRKKYAGGLKNRLKNALKRETPWEKLSGREKARRLVKQLYKKRCGKIENLRALTVSEALEQMMIDPDAAGKTAAAYDHARYSEHEVDSQKMDELRKELRL